jgi:hypothetical protein
MIDLKATVNLKQFDLNFEAKLIDVIDFETNSMDIANEYTEKELKIK